MEKDFTEILKHKTEVLLRETKTDGTLNFYYDQSRCDEDEIVRIWKYEEEVLDINKAVKIYEF